MDADELSNIIRKVDGNHDKGAGALAEAILAEINKTSAIVPREPTEEMIEAGAEAMQDTLDIDVRNETYAENIYIAMIDEGEN